MHPYLPCMYISCTQHVQSITLPQLAATVDIFPTLNNLVRGTLPNVTLDGIDMAPILFENAPVSSQFTITA